MCIININWVWFSVRNFACNSAALIDSRRRCCVSLVPRCQSVVLNISSAIVFHQDSLPVTARIFPTLFRLFLTISVRCCLLNSAALDSRPTTYLRSSYLNLLIMLWIGWDILWLTFVYMYGVWYHSSLIFYENCMVFRFFLY